MEPRQAAIETYRYLRVGLVGLALLLLVAVAAQAGSDGALLTSISAYYYSPVGVVLVGVLVALGLALIVIRGRGVEDMLLNLAGMLAPVVAFVPQPEAATVTFSEDVGRVDITAPAPGADIGIAMWSLLAVGALGVLFAAFTARRHTGADREMAFRGVAIAGVVLIAFAAWLAIGPDSFARAAHYVAAIGMFGALVGVARLNAATAQDTERPVVAMLPAARRRAAYRLISWAMLLTVAAGGVLYVLEVADIVPFALWLFWIETLLLALFAAFWVLQTVEYWRNGVPVD